MPDRVVCNLPTAAFFRFGALAAAAAVFGIILAQLVLVPEPASPGIGNVIRTYADPVFQAQSVTILIQVMAMFVALLIVSVKVFPRSPGVTILAVAALLFWQMFEMLPRSIDHFVFARNYAQDYVAGSGNATLIESEFRRFFDWAAGIRSMRLIVWSGGLFLLGLAVWPVRGLGRWIGGLLMFNGARVALLFALSVSGVAMPYGLWSFIITNIVLFALLACWLWKSPRLETLATGTPG